MFTCEFEDGHKTNQLRHVVVHALVIQDNKILLEKRAGDMKREVFVLSIFTLTTLDL